MSHTSHPLRSLPILFTAIVVLLLSTPVNADPDHVEIELRFAIWDIDGSIQRSLSRQLEEAHARGDQVSLSTVPLHFLRATGDIDEWIIQSVNTPYNSPSAAVTYEGPQTLSILGSRPTEGQPPANESIIATVQLPSDSRSALLLLLPTNGKENADAYRILTLRTDEANFPRGAIQMINLATQDFRLAINDLRTELNTRSIEMIQPSQHQETGLHIQIAGWDENREQWRVFFERHLPNLGKRRAICFIVDNPKAFGRFSARFISVP